MKKLTALLLGASALLSGAAVAEERVWKHGVIEPKADAGLIMVGLQGGFPEKFGLKVEILNLKSDVLGLKALLAGELDSYEGGPAGAITADSRGVDVKIIGCAWPRIPHGLFVRADITDISQLKGKAIAISAPNAFPDLLARAALKKAGVSPDDVKFANLGSDSDRFKALMANVVQASVSSGEFLAVAPPDVKLLFAGRDLMPQFLRNCVMTSGKTIATKRDDMVRFMAAEIAGSRWAVSHKDEVMKITREIAGIRADDPRPEFVFAESIKHGDFDPEMNVAKEKLAWLQNLLVETGDITRPVDIARTFDETIRKDAAALADKTP
jgi:NitT/TauT family transport system substrate-binding protein